MDSKLREMLDKIDAHITNLFRVEHDFLILDGNKKALLAGLTIKASGKSYADRESHALASIDWSDFLAGHSLKEAEYNMGRRRYELLLKAFDATYLTFKVEASVIGRQK